MCIYIWDCIYMLQGCGLYIYTHTYVIVWPQKKKECGKGNDEQEDPAQVPSS